MFVKEFDSRRWLFKKRWMNCEICSNRLYDDLEDLEGVTVSFEHHFENKAPLAINHWVGVFRLTFPWGYRQYITSTAAGKDTAQECLRQTIIRELFEAGLDFEKNTVLFLEDEDSELLDELACA